MDEHTRQQLNEMNRQFYTQTATAFNQTRAVAWQGWQHLIPYILVDTEPYGVLDIGCGNARFANFLAKHRTKPFEYHGIDSNPTLLQYAEDSVLLLPHVTTQFWELDFVEQSLPSESLDTYDLVVVFGVMHHIPGYAERSAFLRSCTQFVKETGLLVFACWRFLDIPRLQKRLQPWKTSVAVESNDYLLDWRRDTHALRYCHYVDDAEHDALVAATGLNELVRFRADGETGNANCYSVLIR